MFAGERREVLLRIAVPALPGGRQPALVRARARVRAGTPHRGTHGTGPCALPTPPTGARAERGRRAAPPRRAPRLPRHRGRAALRVRARGRARRAALRHGERSAGSSRRRARGRLGAQQGAGHGCHDSGADCFKDGGRAILTRPRLLLHPRFTLLPQATEAAEGGNFAAAREILNAALERLSRSVSAEHALTRGLVADLRVALTRLRDRTSLEAGGRAYTMATVCSNQAQRFAGSDVPSASADMYCSPVQRRMATKTPRYPSGPAGGGGPFG